MKKLSRVQKKKRRKKIYSTVGTISIIGFLILMVVLNTKLFSIEKINVSGNKKILGNKIILFSSIEEGDNIFKISTKDAKENINTLNYVKNVEVSRKFPKQININIEERKEAMRIKDTSSFIILDGEGYILDNVDDKNEELPEIIGLKIKNKTIGENAFIDKKEDLKVKFITQLLDLNIISKFKYIDIEDDMNINILTFDNIEVVFGTINNVEYKLNMLNKVFKDIEEKKLDVKMILMDKGENPVVVLQDSEEYEETEETEEFKQETEQVEDVDEESKESEEEEEAEGE